MPALHALCERALANCAPRSFERITGTSAHGILLNDDAVAARAHIVRLLGLWSARVAIGRGVPRTGADVAWRARFLVTNLDWLAAHPQAGVLATDLRALADEAHAAAHIQTRPRRVDLGRCVHDECESVIFTSRAGSGYGAAADSAQVSCDSGHSWAPHEWLSLARGVQSFAEAADSEAAS